MRSCLLALAALSISVTSASAAPVKLTIDQAIAKAITGPRVRMAHGDTAAAAARRDEADAARFPRVKATAFGTISPRIRCENPDCTRTGPQDISFQFKGLFGGGTIDVTQPLYTFGKINNARAAARAGVDAQEALADEAAGDMAVDAARAFWGIKLARELGFMLDDGIEEIQKAIEKFDERTGKEAITIQDRQRVIILLAEAKVQRSDATQGEQQALAGLRALTGVAEVDVDDASLAAVDYELPKAVDGARRPQAIAAKQGAIAYDLLAAQARSYFFPDIALVGSGYIAGAQGADDPPSAYANDPFNKSSAGVVLAVQWVAEPWNVKARADRARAEAAKARAQSDLASAGARYDAQTALSEAIAAREKLTAADDGVKAARTWLAAVLQSEAIGTADPKDLADAYIAWFQMRARWAQAVFQWNVAVVRLGRATGEYRAGGPRP